MVTHMSQDFQAQAAASQRSAGRLFRVHKMFPPHLLLNWTPIWDLKFTPIWGRFPISTFPPLIVETEKEQMRRKLKDRAEEHFNRSAHFFPSKSFKWCNLSIDTPGFKSWPVSRRQMRQMTIIKLFFYHQLLQDGGLNTSGEAEGEIPQKIFVSTQIDISQLN